MKKEIVNKMEEFAIRVLEGGDGVNAQETAILPEVLDILQKETTEDDDGK